MPIKNLLRREAGEGVRERKEAETSGQRVEQVIFLSRRCAVLSALPVILVEKILSYRERERPTGSIVIDMKEIGPSLCTTSLLIHSSDHDSLPDPAESPTVLITELGPSSS